MVRYDPKKAPCTYRYCQEGVQWLSKYTQNRHIYVTESDLKMLLQNPGKEPLYYNLTEKLQRQFDGLTGKEIS